MWVVMDNIAVGKNTQRKLVKWMKKKKPTVGKPGNFDFQKSEADKKIKQTKQQQKENLI